jgi:SAM-dependent methyltransferase
MPRSLSSGPIPAVDAHVLLDRATDVDAVTPPGTIAAIRTRPAPRVLDFGCGYGRSARVLLQAGVHFWGVDISAAEIEKGREQFAVLGLDPKRLAVLDPDGRAPFADASFDVVFTQQVFEHVAELDVAVAEIARLLAPGGVSFHSWPGKWCFVEPHLRAPFVHWLPKGQTRRLAIHLLTRLGARPPWPPELPQDAGLRALAEFEYQYSVSETFYRSFRQVRRSFEAHGLVAAPLQTPRISMLPPLVRPLAAWTARTVRVASLVATRPT